MLQLKTKKDTKNYFSRVLNKSEKYFIVWHGNCYSIAPVNNFTGFEVFLDGKPLTKRKI